MCINTYLLFQLEKFKKILGKKKNISSTQRALEWLQQHRIDKKGITVSTRKRVSYPEVTGYIIPTLYQYNKKTLAIEMAEWLISIQNKDGSFSSLDGNVYTFDTGQVIRGLVTVLDDFPRVKEPLTRACDWVLTQIMPNGEIITPSKKMWSNLVDERIHLYILPSLIKAGQKLNKSQYIEAAKCAINYYKRLPDLLEFNTLTHFYGYIVEALCDLNELDLAKAAMEIMNRLQKQDGSVPASANVSWICTPGLAQLAVIWYKLGMRRQGDAALEYLIKIQNMSGGFYGSYGRGAKYFAYEEISWATKFFLDALYLRNKNKQSQ
jgi:malonyl-CoA O-methyltransferase